MGWQPETQPKGKPPKIIYLCDGKKECNDHRDCGQLCKHTADIRHAVNFINLGDGNYVEERPETPTIDAVPVRHGKWIGYAGTIGAECSVCHKWLDVLQGTAEMNYCPNCGARMDAK